MSRTKLESRLRSGDAVVAGVLSGTSADGIDVAIVRFEPSQGALPLAAPQLERFEIVPFSATIRARVRAVLDGGADGGALDLAGLAGLDRDLGLAFGRAARAVARRAGLELELVGSHGQTVWHHDGTSADGRASLQLGDGDFVCEAAACTVVSDFRARDLAAGGEGAPITALVERALFPDLAVPFAVLNLGGIANVTCVGPAETAAFDTGPAGSLLDGLARALFDEPYDAGGDHAAAGRPLAELVDWILSHPFFARRPPKSTGRDTFGAPFVAALLERAAGARPQDVLASAVQAVAASIADAAERFVQPPPARWVVAGGGARNTTLIAALTAALDALQAAAPGRQAPVPVESSAVHGVDPDAREALAFAYLAAANLLGQGVTQAAITGAAAGRVLGKISPAFEQER